MVMGYLMTLGMNCADPNMGKPKPGRTMPSPIINQLVFSFPPHGQTIMVKVGLLIIWVLFTGKIIIIPAWVKEKQYTLRGTRLKERNYDQSGNGTYWVNDSYEWGYADNFSAIDRLTDDDNYNAGPSDNHFKISHAVTFDGKDANLKYVDFIKVQVGVNSKSGWLGEISTEVFGIKDFNMLK